MLKIVKPSTEAERTTRTTLDTIEVTPQLIKQWRKPDFQREKKINSKVEELCEELKHNGGVLPGVITLGCIASERYLVDGQHRIEAFLMSGMHVGYCDIRVLHVKDMSALATEFYKLNSRMVQMKPDDYLRALETTNDQLARLRRKCPFVGFDMIRRGDRAPILSMSSVLRCWSASGKEVPQPQGGGGVVGLANQFTEEECTQLTQFLAMAHRAWGRDDEYRKLWNNLNLTLCMWLYRRMVITQYSSKTPKLDDAAFQRCITGLSADGSYLDWLVGRNSSERDRGPCLARIKTLFAKRLEAETGKKPSLPQPAWGSK